MFKKMIIAFGALCVLVVITGCTSQHDIPVTETFEGKYISQELYNSLTDDMLCCSVAVNNDESHIVDIEAKRMPQSGKFYYTMYEYKKAKDKWKQVDCMLTFSQSPEELDKAFTDLVES